MSIVHFLMKMNTQIFNPERNKMGGKNFKIKNTF